MFTKLLQGRCFRVVSDASSLCNDALTSFQRRQSSAEAIFCFETNILGIFGALPASAAASFFPISNKEGPER